MVTSKRTIRISDEEWNEFKTLCGKNGVDCSSKIRELIRDHIDINEKEVQQSNNQDIYNLLDNIHNRMGEIHIDVIERNTQPIQRESVLKYCEKKGYKVTNPTFELKISDEKAPLNYRGNCTITIRGEE